MINSFLQVDRGRRFSATGAVGLRGTPVDQATWAEVSRQYNHELLLRARREGIPHDDAEDIVQEVLKAATNYRGTGGAEVRTFLIAVLQNQVRKWIRRASRSRSMVAVDSVAESLPDGTRDPSEAACDAETKELVLRCFGELPDYCRNVCEMRHVYGLSYREIADELAIPLETVKSRLHRARKMLQERLRDVL